MSDCSSPLLTGWQRMVSLGHLKTYPMSVQEKILDDLLVVFDSGKVNKITRELLMYYIAVAHQRILSGHVLSHEAGAKVCNILFEPL